MEFPTWLWGRGICFWTGPYPAGHSARSNSLWSVKVVLAVSRSNSRSSQIQRRTVREIQSNKFRIQIPDEYSVAVCSQQFKQFPNFYDDKRYSSLWGVGDRYEVNMGGCQFAFHTDVGDKTPQGLADWIFASTKHYPTLTDIVINGIEGKMEGGYSSKMSWIDWWFKKGDCLICFNFQGMGEPSEEIKQDVQTILESMRYEDEEGE